MSISDDDFMEAITKLQDEEGHWYSVPNFLVNEFNMITGRLSGKDYMDCPDKFDVFTNRFEIFRTMGDENLEPDCFKK